MSDEAHEQDPLLALQQPHVVGDRWRSPRPRPRPAAPASTSGRRSRSPPRAGARPGSRAACSGRRNPMKRSPISGASPASCLRAAIAKLAKKTGCSRFAATPPITGTSTSASVMSIQPAESPIQTMGARADVPPPAGEPGGPARGAHVAHADGALHRPGSLSHRPLRGGARARCGARGAAARTRGPSGSSSRRPSGSGCTPAARARCAAPRAAASPARGRAPGR